MSDRNNRLWLYKFILALRPAPLGVALKHLLGIKRRVLVSFPLFSVAASHGRCEAPRRAVRGRRGLAGAAARPSRRRAVVGERLVRAESAHRSTAGRPRPGRAERDPG